MKIKKDSWHFKLLNFEKWGSKVFPWYIKEWHTYSLCGYFWRVVWTLLFLAVVGPGLVIGGGAILGILAFYVGWIVFYPILQIWFPFVPVSVLSFLFWLLVGMWFLCAFRGSFTVVRRSELKTCEEKFSLVGEYLEAKHRKVCPILEFE